MHYVLPLTAFAAGIFIAERIESRYKSSRTLHWRQIILLIEIVMLRIVGFMTKELNMLANMMVSFSCVTLMMVKENEEKLNTATGKMKPEQ